MVSRTNAVPRSPSLVALAVAALLIGPSAWGQRAAEDAFRCDDRLQAAVTLSLRDRPFAEVAQALGDATGVPMRAAGNVADDKACVFVGSMPAQELMGQIADHFGCRWRLQDRGYVLETTQAQQAIEVSRRARARERGLTALHAKMSALQRLSGLTAEQVEARCTEIASLLAAGGLTPEAASSLTEEQKLLGRLRATAGRIALAVLAGLTSHQSSQLRSGGAVVLDQLPPDLVSRVHDAVRVGRPVQAAGPADTPLTASASLRIETSAERGTGVRQVNGVRPRTMSLRVGLTARKGGRFAGGTEWYVSVDLADPAERRSPGTVGRSALDRDIDVRLAAPAGPARTSMGQPVAPSLGVILERVHAETGLNVIADSFMRARVGPSVLAGTPDARALLDRICHKLNYTWEQEADTIRVRSNQFCEDKLCEAPDRLLQPLRARASSGEQVTLDDYANLVCALTEPQTATLDDFWENAFGDIAVPRLMGAYRLLAVRNDLRLWTLLDARQREMALSPSGLPASRLNAAQTSAYLLAAANREPSTVGWAPSGYEPTRDDILAGAFTVRRSEQAIIMSPPDASGHSQVTAYTFTPGYPGPVQDAPGPRFLDTGVGLPEDSSRRPCNQYSFCYLPAAGDSPLRTSVFMIQRTRKAKGTEE